MDISCKLYIYDKKIDAHLGNWFYINIVILLYKTNIFVSYVIFWQKRGHHKACLRHIEIKQSSKIPSFITLPIFQDQIWRYLTSCLSLQPFISNVSKLPSLSSLGCSNGSSYVASVAELLELFNGCGFSSVCVSSVIFDDSWVASEFDSPSNMFFF